MNQFLFYILYYTLDNLIFYQIYKNIDLKKTKISKLNFYYSFKYKYFVEIK
jgi:hypothetical protein